MRYSLRETDTRDPAVPGTEAFLFQSLEPVIRGMGMSLIELSLFQHRGRAGRNTAPRRSGETFRSGQETAAGNVRVRAVIYKKGITGVEDCTRVHRGIMPRLELAFPGKEIFLEVSSPGINRIIKDGREFAHYIGRGVSCYCVDISEWTGGILVAADENQVILRNESGEVSIQYEKIAKACINDALTP